MAGFDDIKSKGLLSDRSLEILKEREQKMKSRSVEEVRVLERILKDQEAIDKLRDDVNKTIKEKMSGIAEISASMQELDKLQDRLQRTREYGVQKQFYSKMHTSISSRATTEDLNAIRTSSSTFGRSVGMAQQYGTSELEAIVSRNRSLLSKQESRILNTAEAMGEDPSKLGVLINQLSTRHALMQNIGSAEAALSTQRKMGLDIKSRYHSAADITGRIRSERERYQIAQDVAAGRAGSREEAQEKLNKVSEQLISTFERLDEAVQSQSKNADELAKEFEKVRANYSKANETVRQMDKQGYGYENLRSLSNIFGVIGDAGVVAQGVAQGMRYRGITSEVEQMQNRIGIANLTNTRFTDQMAAARGDAAAIRRVTSDTFSRAARRGADFSRQEQDYMVGEATGKSAQFADALVQSTLKQFTDDWKGTLFSTVVGTPAGGLAKTAIGAAAGGTADALQLNQLITDYQKNISSGRALLTGANQYIDYRNAVNVIPDYMNQSMINRLMGTGMSSRGIGAIGRESLLRGVLSGPGARALAGAGLEGDALYSAMSAGTSALGVEMRGQSGMDALMAAGQFTQAGYFQSPGQYMQARGMLTDVGGRGEDLEKIMRSAVAAGMDSSKNIMQMVSATTQLSRASAGAGINVIGGAEAMMARGVQALTRVGVSPNMAAQAALNAQNYASQVATSGDLDIANVLEFAEVRGEFGDKPFWQQMAISRADPIKLEQLEKEFMKGNDVGKAAAVRMGLGGIQSPGDLRKAQNITRRQVINRTAGFFMNNGIRQQILEGIEGKTPFEKLDTNVQDYLNWAAQKENPNLSGAALYAGQQFDVNENQGMAQRGGQGKLGRGAEGALAAGGEAEAKVFSDAIKQFSNSVDGLSQLGGIMQALANVDPGKMAKETEEAAKKMTIPVGQFSNKMSEVNGKLVQFMDALDKIIGKMGGGGPLKDKANEPVRWGYGFGRR